MSDRHVQRVHRQLGVQSSAHRPTHLGRPVVFTAHYDGVSRGGKLVVALEGHDGKTLTRIQTIPFEAGNGNTAIKIPGAPEGMNFSLADPGDCYSLVARCIESALHQDPP